MTKLRQIGFSLGLASLLFSANAARASVAVDATQTFQFIRGFGGASAWDSASSLSALAPTLWAVDNQNGHVGLSMLRTRIDPTGSFAAEAGPMTLAKAQNPNILIWSTEWTPPAAYKNNDNVDGPASNNTFNNTAANSTAYANYLVNYVNTIKSTYGVTLYALSPQNEPDQNVSYESCLWTPAQFDDFIKNYLGPAFQRAGLTTKILMPEHSKDTLSLSDTTMNDAAAKPFVGIIGGHLYGGGPNALPASYGNVENWETEISDVSGAANDATMKSGLQEAGWIHSSLVTASMNAFHHWWLRGDSASNEGLFDENGGATKKLYVLGNYSKFIRPGFYRMGATAAPASGVSVSAYKNAAAGAAPTTIVVVAINKNTSASSQTFTLTGVTASSVTPWLTDPNNNLVAQAAVAVSGGSFSYSLPQQSVVSFVATVGGTAPTSTPVPPTASPTSTATRSNTPTNSRTATATNSSTQTATRTNTATSTATNSPSNTPSRTSTPTDTLTSTVTSTWTSSATSTPSNTATATQTLGSPSATATPQPASTWRIDSGSTAAYTDVSGNLWSADAGFNSGTARTLTQTVTGTTDPSLYKSERYGNNTYTFAVNPGSYQVTLKFAETYLGITATGQRVFNVSLNGATVLTNLDLFKEVGSLKADDKVFSNVSPANGQIVIQLGPATANNATVCGIQVIPQPLVATATPVPPTATASATRTASPTPTATATATATATPQPATVWRLDSGSAAAYTDGSGNLWAADAHFSSGTARSITQTVTGGADPALYESERYGNNTYTLAVNPGSYQVTLKFAETYLGITAAGQRVFNVSLNGSTVLTNLDIFSEVGQLKTDDKVFNNVSPVNGQILIQLGPASANNATICGIQVIPQPASGDMIASRVGLKDAPVVTMGPQLLLAPNPAKDHVEVFYHLTVPGKAVLSLSGLDGSLLQRLDLGEQGLRDQKLSLDLRSLASGVYIAVLQSNEGQGLATRAKFKLAIRR